MLQVSLLSGCSQFAVMTKVCEFGGVLLKVPGVTCQYMVS